MKYIKNFENEQNIQKYKSGDMIIINKPEWQIIHEPAIVKEYVFDHYICMFLLSDIYDSNLNYVIMEEEILRKMTEEEIKNVEFKRSLKKYNL